MGEAKKTTDHRTIKQWVEERDGIPATVKGTAQGGEKAGLLRIDFPEHGEPKSLEPLEWEEFFEKFDDAGLEFLYQDEPESRFCKFVSR